MRSIDIENFKLNQFSKIISKIDKSNPTDEDYENVYRRKTKFELVLISLVVFGIEICYAAETAFVSPILQKIGVPIEYTSMVWGLSPIIGFFTCPLLGSLSDDSNSSLGRRRPYIILYSLGILIGLILTGYGHIFGNFFLVNNGVNPMIIFFTVLGVVLLDFDCDACQSPARAYLIDVSQEEDHSVGLSTFTVMAGAGGCIGYVLGGIPWSELTKGEDLPSDFNQSLNITPKLTYSNDDIAYSHKQILFTSVAIIYIICSIISLTSFKEIPLYLLKKKKPIQIDTDLEDDCQSVYDYDASKSYDKISSFTYKLNISWKEKLRIYIKSIIHMPNSIWWLCITHGFCWMSLLCYSLYFTDFVGEVIFEGIPSDEEQNSELNSLYDKGVRIGSLCMALYSISCSFYSHFLQRFIDKYGTRVVYTFSQIIYSIGMLILAITKLKVMIPITSLTAGVMYSCLFTIPFILIAKYHTQESFQLLIDNDNPNINRGLGTDISIVSSMVFVAQFILSFFIGSLIKLIGTKTVVIYGSSFFSFCAAITAQRISYLD
ncbi:unnamed protein product [Brachionus calyciflorus]|uniref:Uncharacterized protein n=1 Tax=Brachionus calyciflorus TaxID=104777 RepID=A0A813R187_9BILA|nr:unnamed protein product [Brachionus calyciflorus]